MTVMTWAVIAILFMVLEMVTVTLISIWFVIGAIAAAITAAFTSSLMIQLVVFVGVSVAMLLLTKPFVKNFRNKPIEATNADRIIGAKGIIAQDVDIVQGTGQVKVNGQIWTCRSADQSVIKAGANVEIIRIEGVKAIVKRP